ATSQWSITRRAASSPERTRRKGTLRRLVALGGARNTIQGMARREGPPQRWLSGFGAFEWRTDERAYASLLDALTRDRLETEAVEREMQTAARRSLAEVQQDQQRAERDELAEARRELDDFRAAIDDVRRRGRGDDRKEVPYDSR